MTGAGIVYLIYITSTSWILAAVAVAALLAFGVVTTLCVLWSRSSDLWLSGSCERPPAPPFGSALPSLTPLVPLPAVVRCVDNARAV